MYLKPLYLFDCTHRVMHSVVIITVRAQDRDDVMNVSYG